MPLTAADLGIRRLDLPAGAALTDPGTAVGRAPAVEVPSGAPLRAADLQAAPVAPAGHALVGVALPPGRLPADGLHAGDLVRLVTVVVPGQQPPVVAPGQTLLDGVAVAEARPGEQQTLVITLAVPDAQAQAVEQAAAADAVSAERLPPPATSRSPAHHRHPAHHRPPVRHPPPVRHARGPHDLQRPPPATPHRTPGAPAARSRQRARSRWSGRGSADPVTDDSTDDSTDGRGARPGPQ